MKKRTLLWAIPFVTSGLVFACSAPSIGFSPDAHTSAAAATTKGDDMTLEASDETKAAIGVSRWSAKSADGQTTVHGYDPSGKIIVTLMHTVTNVSDSESTIKDAVSGDLGSAALGVQMTAGVPDADGNVKVTTKVTQNTFKSGEGPAKVLAAALADQNSTATWQEAKANVGTGVSTQSLHVLDTALTPGDKNGGTSLNGNGNSEASLTDGGGSAALTQCVGKTISCIKSIADAVGTGFKAATSCSDSLPKGSTQTSTCKVDSTTKKVNVAEGGLRGPEILKNANCADATPDPATTGTDVDAGSVMDILNGCLQDALDAIKGGADAVDSCAQIAGCADDKGGSSSGSGASASTASSSSTATINPNPNEF